MTWRLRLPGALYRRAVERAGSDADLARLVAAYLTRYAEGQHADAARARSASLTPERRSEIARAAVATRWARRTET